MRKATALLLVISMLAWSSLAVVEVGPGTRFYQSGFGSNVNFSQALNFTGIGVRPLATDFGPSNFSVDPESSSSAELDFYDYDAGRQSFVTNFTARASPSESVTFNLTDLPSNAFYEAFYSDTGNRIYIGNKSGEEFKFSDTVSNDDVSVFNFGTKGVEADNITFNNSDPFEGETVDIIQHIFNEGSVEDEVANKTLTIETYNGSEWIQTQYRSSDETVPVNDVQLKDEVEFQGTFNRTTDERNAGNGGLGLGYQNGTSGDSLVGYWRFDEAVSGSGGTVEDYSGNNNDGTTKNGVSTGFGGVFSTNSFDFDGTNDYVDTGDPNKAFNPLTISFWFKPDDVSTQGQRLVYRDDSSGWAVSLGDPGTGRLRFFTRSLSTISLDTDEIIETGNWYHVVAIWDSANGVKQIWVNNTLEAEDTGFTGSLSDEGDPIKLGGDGGTSNNWFDGSLDEVRIYNSSLSQSEVEDLYLEGRPFRGNFTTEEIDNSGSTDWYRLNVDADVPSGTDLTAEFNALDSSDNVVGSRSFEVKDGDYFYNISGLDSEDGEVVLNGTSSDVEKSWDVDSLRVYSGDGFRDEWVAEAGPWRFNVSIDEDEQIKETNESNNEANRTLEVFVDSWEIRYGDSDLTLEVGADTDDMYFWNPAYNKGFLYFFDSDSDFQYSDLEAVNASDFDDANEALNMTGHKDGIEDLWDADGDGFSDNVTLWELAGSDTEVPVTNSSEDDSFKTGLMYDSADGTPYDGSQDLVFVTKMNPQTEGEFGTYDYEARIPFSLDTLKDPVDNVTVVREYQ